MHWNYHPIMIKGIYTNNKLCATFLSLTHQQEHQDAAVFLWHWQVYKIHTDCRREGGILQLILYTHTIIWDKQEHTNIQIHSFRLWLLHNLSLSRHTHHLGHTPIMRFYMHLVRHMIRTKYKRVHTNTSHIAHMGAQPPHYHNHIKLVNCGIGWSYM